MTREFLFRGQRTDNKEWVYGSLIRLKILTSICVESEYDNLSVDAYFNECCFPVIPETVTQFTGLLDKNGVKIYEGDIVKKDGMISDVRFYDSAFRIGVSDLVTSNVEIIGNIFEGEGNYFVIKREEFNRDWVAVK